jgi:hypothetical protein
MKTELRTTIIALVPGILALAVAACSSDDTTKPKTTTGTAGATGSTTSAGTSTTGPAGSTSSTTSTTSGGSGGAGTTTTAAGSGGSVGTTGAGGGTTTTTTAAGGAGGAGTGGAGTGGAGGGTAACTAGTIRTGTNLVIDDFAHANNMLPVNDGRGGAWARGSASNGAGTPISPVGGALPLVANGDTDAFVATVLALGKCVDASANMGVQFRVTGTSTTLFFRLGMPETTGTSAGGICNETVPMNVCFAHYQAVVTERAGAVVRVPFSSMMMSFATPTVPFSPAELLSVVFVTTDTMANLMIDDLAFY